MTHVLIQMALVILAGILWQRFNPLQMSAEQIRNVITGLVYYLFLPALVLLVLWQTELGGHSLRIAFIAACGVLSTAVLAIIVYRILPVTQAAAGALILAAAFPNVTYLGLPILERSLGPWARSIAIQYDLFACMPLFFTLAIIIAQTYGKKSPRLQNNQFLALFRVPALWAAVTAVLLSILEISMPQWIHDGLNLISQAVVPLMLFSLGLALSWKNWQIGQVNQLLPVLVLQLIVQPLMVWVIADATGFTGKKLLAIVLEAAMPSMLLGLMLCDRYRLDTNIYALAVTASTAASVVTLPIWFYFID